MLKEKRLQTIMDIIKREGEVYSKDLCEIFSVTDMTIRRDLNTLAASGAIIRTHGGAVFNSDEGLLEPSYSSRLDEQIAAKKSIARKAQELISGNGYVFLDSGTSTLSIAQQVPYDARNTFITNSLTVALELINHQNVSVITIGGDLDRNTVSSRGVLAEKQLSNFRVDIAFLGCNAVSAEGDVLIGSIAETSLKHQIMKISHHKYLLADASKFGKYSLISYASVKDFDGIITNSCPPDEIAETLEQAGGRLFIADSERRT